MCYIPITVTLDKHRSCILGMGWRGSVYQLPAFFGSITTSLSSFMFIQTKIKSVPPTLHPHLRHCVLAVTILYPWVAHRWLRQDNFTAVSPFQRQKTKFMLNPAENKPFSGHVNIKCFVPKREP